MYKYDGFDPLEVILVNENDAHKDLLKTAKKREITNILKCYTGYFDIFSEMLQNSLDAIERVWRKDNSYKPIINIEINMNENSITVSDNGSGMEKDQFEFCVAPNISFKNSENLRGNKGVGATFLAYGFNNIKIHTKTKNFETRIILTGGRRWVECINEDIERPKFRFLDHPINSFLDGKTHGTIFKVTLQPGEKPKLTYLLANNAEQWIDILRIRTPLGGIYLSNIDENSFKPKIILSVIDVENNYTETTKDGAEYYYCHEIPNLKVECVSDIDKAIESISGCPEERYFKLADRFKKLNAIYDVWDWKAILNEEYPLKLDTGLSLEQRELVEKHKISVYGFFCNSTRIFDRFNDDILKVRKSYRILKGGLQLATDGMTQGELITIPLTRAVWYQNQTHVIVHFEQGEPDLGRKTFQQDKTDLALKLAINVVNLLKKYRHQHLKPDETSEPLIPDLERHNWIRENEEYLKSNPILKSKETSTICILAKPQKEQDVVALFNQMLGAGIIKGLEIYATDENNRYDSLFRLAYNDETIFYSDEAPLGVSQDIIVDLPYISEPKILEYKYDFDALVRECLSGEKFHQHINLVVAWNASLHHQGKVELKSLLIERRGCDLRKIFGSTHLAYLSGHYDSPIYEVIILEDLLNYLIDANKEEINQRKKYED